MSQGLSNRSLRPQRANTFSAAQMEAADISPNDYVIALMGPTGAGKTSFIQLLTQKKLVIGDSLESCTPEVGVHKCSLSNGRTVWLVDTPGFDDTHRPNEEILAEIAQWLAMSYEQSTLLSGIIYLHRISDPRMTGPSLRNLRMFRKLCGDDGLGNVVLATTFWAKVTKEDGDRREKELMSSGDFWGYLMSKGSSVFRHDQGQVSAERMINSLIDRSGGKVALAIQKEVVDEKKTLEQTAAGQDVASELQEARRAFEDALVEMKKEQAEALRTRDEYLQQVLSTERAKFAEQLEHSERRKEVLSQGKDELKREGSRCILM